MPEPSALLLFLAASLVLLVVPGPAVFYIVTQSIDQGPRAGVVSALGVAVGSVLHTAAAALGVSALVASSVTAFELLRWLGAAYLVWLGIRRLLARDDDAATVAAPPRPLGPIFLQGIVVNVLNPKTILFLFAFLPQFVNPAAGHVALQILVLGMLFSGLGVLSDGTYALLAGGIGGWLRRNGPVLRMQRYVVGGAYVALGVAAVFAGSQRK